ncbi:hypothetical protein [Streptomyces rochei]|uniref:hypothetical protein n=1 Tax=Streptomyces rochei TaxID=1928 RepID=UPI0033BE81CB
MVELIPLGKVRPLSREARTLGDSLTLAVLTISSVIAVTLFVIRGVLDQLPGVFSSWHRAIEAMRASRSRGRNEGEPEHHHDD